VDLNLSKALHLLENDAGSGKFPEGLEDGRGVKARSCLFRLLGAELYNSLLDRRAVKARSCLLRLLGRELYNSPLDGRAVKARSCLFRLLGRELDNSLLDESTCHVQNRLLDRVKLHP
jgi:hypothetical protein